MDFYISRAMQIGCLDRYQIEKLHAKETSLGECLANFEIQRIFGIPEIKAKLMIPNDDGLQDVHAKNVRCQLLTQKVAVDEPIAFVSSNGEARREILKPWQSIVIGRLQAVHAYDWSVHEAVDAGRVSLHYAGPSSSGNRLRDRVTRGKAEASF